MGLERTGGLLAAAAACLACAAPAAQAATPVFVSELHYDNAGTDAGEAIEVAAPAGTDLGGWSLVLYNGNGGAPYGTKALTGVVPDQGGGRGTLAFTYPTDGLQNGAPDGIALVQGSAVVQFLSYEGVMTAVGGPADGRQSTDIGVAETSSTPAGQSLQLTGTGTTAEELAWTGPAAASFGQPNAGVVTPPPGPSTTCGDAATTIAQVQGSGAQSTRVGERVAVEGVVVGDFQGADRLNGLFLQDPQGDGDPATSEGLYVFGNGASTPDVAAGDRVRVVGTVAEFKRSSDATGDTVTELTSPSGLSVCQTGAGLPAPVDVSLPADRSALERVEGMRVRFPQALALTEYFQLDDFGEAVLSQGGPLSSPTEVAEPGPAARAVAADNARRSVVLDDGSSQSDPRPVPYLGSPDDPIRRGDTTSGLTGVLTYDFARFRVQPTAPVAFQDAGERRAAPRPVGGDVKVGDANVLNYFTTLGRRGARTPEELVRQRQKAVKALNGLDADVLALQEVESNGGQALDDLVAALNADAGPGTWASVPVPASFSGTDEITVALIYKPGRVQRVGASVALADPVFNPGRQPIAQTFASGGERFTVVANHLKSKGCDGATGADTDQGDGQSCFNATRIRQAQRTQEWVRELQRSTDDEDVLLLGDFNAYGREDPLDVLRANGLEDQLERFLDEGDRWSYVFDGGQGALDHAFVTAAVRDQVTGAAVWHINAPESDALAYYGVPDHFRPDAHRASDHDPAVLGLRTTSQGFTCGGRRATIVGTDGPDRLVGTPDADVIVARGGDDEVTGDKGEDVICAGEGDDRVDAGPGADRVDEGPGQDEVRRGERPVTAERRPLVIGHRGASGYRPEHTLAAYRLAAEQGADVIEPDLVITKDGVLVARHENEIGGTTDVASHPEFASRRTTKTIDGTAITGWFTEDFTLRELKTLRAKERIPELRPQNTRYDGLFEVPTLQEVLDLRARLSRELGREVGVYPETKHPTYFRSIGKPLEHPLVRTLERNGLDREDAPVFVQSFETGNLRDLDRELEVPLVQLLSGPATTPVGDTRTYGELATPAGLRSIARYADGVGPSKDYVVPRNANGSSGTPTSFVRDAHAAGLLVHPYTFRRENTFLPLELRSSSDPAGIGDLEAEVRMVLDLGVDGVFSDDPDIAVAARAER
ncbi:ExeM/NucH family extracellular endonuclease [Conexibacter sp. SYSU D00693]|uniref:ExeM/NucH family extracellular endonuclease n=1 Tax=Conexibacter sp. SYSU D00693 TaxID=2812560 RepID=UPI00196B9745|nr:ExeM/NucH family extracellular endonuclease [Conexibacter sp. SYSU D00693]